MSIRSSMASVPKENYDRIFKNPAKLSGKERKQMLHDAVMKHVDCLKAIFESRDKAMRRKP